LPADAESAAPRVDITRIAGIGQIALAYPGAIDYVCSATSAPAPVCPARAGVVGPIGRAGSR